MWLAEKTDILREISKALPSPKTDNDDPLSELRALNALTPEQRKKNVMDGVCQSVETCLLRNIDMLSQQTTTTMGAKESKDSSNSKFSFDASLFDAK
jgi:hypothetical protein